MGLKQGFFKEIPAFFYIFVDTIFPPCYIRKTTGNEVLFFCPKIQQRVKINGGMIMRTRITLACTECKNRNYDTTKDKKTHPDRMEIKKYCKFCRKHTIHKETK